MKALLVFLLLLPAAAALAQSGQPATGAYGPFPASASQRAKVIVRDNAGNLIQLFAK